MPSRVTIPVLAAVVTALTAAPARGQVQAVTVFAHGGGYNALKSVNTIGTADFKTGFNLGGGIGVQVDPNVEFRASVTGAQSHFLDDGAETGVFLNRYYFGGDIKAQYVLQEGVAPYGLLGGGAVLLHEKGTSGSDKLQGFAHLGLGISRTIRTSGFSLFVQGDWFIYSLSQLTGGRLRPYSRTQFDLGWSAGASYKLAR